MSNQSWVSKINSLVLSLQFLQRSYFKPCDTTFRGRYQFYSPWNICFDDWNTMQSVQMQHYGLLSKTTTHKGLAWHSSCHWCHRFQWASLWFLRFPAYYETCKWHNTARQHILVGYFSNDNETQAILWSLIAKTAKHRNIFPMGFVQSNSLPSKRWYSKNPVMISNYIDSVSNQAVSSVFGIKSSLSFEWYKRGYQHQFRSLQVVNWFTIWSSIFKELKMFLMIRRVIQ